ncbi:unnamed protein product [Allacma fusca]|uniref:La-related protein 6 n=1 Tax=Allacma fusca TaxID=39272 RepID=A0A8J2K350_9HEXA|nr:unnamed protein product [Allacma fusca]
MWKLKSEGAAVAVGEEATENTWLRPSPAMYKLLAAAHLTQSVLNAVACLIFVSLTKLWACLHTKFVDPVWKSLCANFQEYQQIVTPVYLTEDNSIPTIVVTTTEPEESVEAEPTDRAETQSNFSQVFDRKEENKTDSIMTIEVPAECPPPSALPVLRINSVNIEDPLLDSTQFIMSSSDGEEQEQDRDPIFTDSELSSSNEGGQLVRRDSDTSDVSSNDGSAEDMVIAPAPEVASKIISQVENMFSDDHLAKDGFLLKHVRRRSDGFVSLKLVAGLRKVKQISREFPTILNALKQSDKLEVNDEGTKIRRVEPLTPTLKALPIASQKNKEKEVLSKSPSSSGDDLPGRNANGVCLSFSTGFTVSADNNKENKRQFGRNAKRNSKDFGLGQKDQQQYNNQQHKQLSRQNCNANNNEREIVLRRRGGSLPIAMGPIHTSQRPASTYLSPNSSPPNNFLPSRPKSNSYCEGLMTSSTMSPWLARRKAASEGNVIISSVIRQPRGPDGTRGFAPGPRPLLIQAN